MHSTRHGGRAAESCAYLTCADGNVQVKGGVRFLPLAGRHIAAAVCHVVRARQRATACSTPEEMEITAEMSQCPVTCFLAHELSPKEIALLQGKPCSACSVLEPLAYLFNAEQGSLSFCCFISCV